MIVHPHMLPSLSPESTVLYFFYVCIYILLSRYSNNRNLNLCLHNKYLLGGLVFKIFKIVKIVFLLCLYVRYNWFFPTEASPPTSLKFAHVPTRKNENSHPAPNFYLPRPRHQKFILLTK